MRVFPPVLLSYPVMLLCMVTPADEPDDQPYVRGGLVTRIAQLESEQFSVPSADDLKLHEAQLLLFVAAQDGHTELVQRLLKLGLHPNYSKHEKGETSLFPATYRGHSGVVRLLLQHGADPNMCNAEKRTPLMLPIFACDQGAECARGQEYKNCLYLLLHYGAHLEQQYEELRKVICERRADVPSVLLQSFLVRKSLLFEAVKDRNVDQFKQLARVITLLVKDEQGNTPLHWAVKKSCPDLVSLILVANPLLVGIKNREGRTPLHLVPHGSAETFLCFLPKIVDTQKAANVKNTMNAIEVIWRRPAREMHNEKGSGCSTNDTGDCAGFMVVPGAEHDKKGSS